MYAPKRTKYRKQQKGRVKGSVTNIPEIFCGKYVIRSLQTIRLKSNTIEAVRRAMSRKLKRNGQIWIKTFPDLSVTSKPLEVRMGKGKGSLDHWASRIQTGQILFEFDGVSSVLAQEAALLAASKLPMRVVFNRLHVC